MGCSGCRKAKEAMQAKMQQAQGIPPSPIVPAVSVPQKTPRQLRIEARNARIKARNDAAELARRLAAQAIKK